MTEFEFTEKVNSYKNMVFRLAITYLKNVQNAEDVTQDVFIKLYQNDKEFQSKEHEKAWLIRVTVNASKDVLKSAWMKKTVPIVGDIVFKEKEDSDLYHAIHRLKPKYRTAIHLYYYEDYSVKEIAKIIEVTETAVQTRLHRARKQLKNILEQDYCMYSNNKEEDRYYETGI